MSRRLAILIFVSSLVVTALVFQTTFSQLLNTNQGSISQAERVHNLDTGLNYTSIQEAIDAPETLGGHTIFVDAGTYYEEVVVNKPISLVGENKSNTVIDGSGSLDVLAIKSDGVFVSGFTVMHSYGEPGSGGGGLVVGGVGNVQISDIIACYNDADWGVHLVPGSHDINITHTVVVNNSRGGLVLNGPWKANVYGNTIVSNIGAGIALMHAQNSSISDNTITANEGNGIHLWESSNNTIYGNTVTNNNEGISFESSPNNSISGNNITENKAGIHLWESSNSSIIGNNITNNRQNEGISLDGSSDHNSISGNDMANNDVGIYVLGCSSNSISRNNIANNIRYGIEFRHSSYNTISKNTITANNGTGAFIDDSSNNSVFNNTIFDNYIGFSVQHSHNNTLSNNHMANNTCNFAIYSNTLLDFTQDIDSSNTVDEKPMYYWVDEENLEIPGDGGYVALINSRNITVQDLNLARNSHGVLLAYTTNSTVKNVTTEFNGIGIGLQSSHNNTLLGNVASNNTQYGIGLSDSGGNVLRNNTMTDNAIVNFGYMPGPTTTPSAFINDVDPSNKVDGKPIYYWVNQSNRHVPSDAGCVLIINSTDITVSNLTLTHNVFGVGLIYSTNSLVRNVTVRNNMWGVVLGWCVNTLVEESNVTDNAQGGLVVMASVNSNLTHNWVSGHHFVPGPEGGPFAGGGFSVLFSNTTIIANNTIRDNFYGIALANSHHSKLSQNSIKNNENGIYLQHSNSSMLTRNNVTHNNFGIQLDHSDKNELIWNKVANNTEGIRLQESYGNILTLNNITANINSGLDLFNSGSNALRNNSLTDNQWNFGIWGDALSDFINDVDTSNTVNDNPIVYLVNQTNLTIDPSSFSHVGCVVVVNSTNITVRSLILEKNYETITFAYTSNSTITNVTATDNFVSILLWNANNNTLASNTITENVLGPAIGSSSENRLVNNDIINNLQGLGLFSNSHNNTLIGNVVENSSTGIYLRMSEENTFFHNNFINNTNQVHIENSPNNIWDDGVEGNYWSDYYGFDLNDDGIGDSWHEIDQNNTDHYPLMGMFISFNTSSGYPVNVISNSTIEDFECFDGTIKLLVSNMTTNQTQAFCRITIPHDVMSPPYNVTINDNPVSHTTIYENETLGLSIIYFSYEHSTLEIIIIPEFLSFLILPVFMTATLLAVIVYRRKRAVKLHSFSNSRQ